MGAGGRIRRIKPMGEGGGGDGKRVRGEGGRE